MLMFRTSHDLEMARVRAEQEKLERQIARLRLQKRELRRENDKLRRRLRRDLEKQPVGSAADLASSQLDPMILKAIASAPADERVRRGLLEHAEMQVLAGKKPEDIAQEIVSGGAGPDFDDDYEE